MILTLYSSPTAKVRVNGGLSGAFSVSNGTRQGCPLSPLIFILTMEPMLRRIRENPDIKGIEINQKQYKVAAYADDVLLFLTDPITTIPNLLRDFTLFKTLSNLQINFSKSKALNISLTNETVIQCKHNFPFGWESQAITYLGIKIPARLTDLYRLNFIPILQTIQNDLQKWQTGPFSWFGRIAILKMNILPRILYLLQTIPILLPLSFFATYKRICRKFIWLSKQPRLNWHRLTLPKLQGGLQVPDIQTYYRVCHLARIVDWHIHSREKEWVHIENAFTKILLKLLPWINPQHIPKTATSNPLINSTLLNFKAACKIMRLQPTPGPMTPIEDNPDFKPGVSLLQPTNDPQRTRLTAQHMFLHGSLLSHQALNDKLPDYNIPLYKYLQIRHFINSLQPTANLHRELTPFERLCNSQEPQRHLISTIHALLFTSHDIKEDKLLIQLKTELNQVFTPDEWRNVLTHIHKGSINVAIQECKFKIYTKWYRTPDKINKFIPNVSPKCWRCNAARRSLLHIWWECPLIQPYWADIHRLITQITTYTPDFTPAQFLLHHTSIPQRLYKKSLVLHLINAANLCIPVHWRSTSPPSITEWIRRVDRVAEIENLIHQTSDTPSKFRET